jgi:hypothetical protein
MHWKRVKVFYEQPDLGTGQWWTDTPQNSTLHQSTTVHRLFYDRYFAGLYCSVYETRLAPYGRSLDIAVSHHADHRPVYVPITPQSRFPVLLPMIIVTNLYQCSGMDRIITS